MCDRVGLFVTDGSSGDWLPFLGGFGFVAGAGIGLMQLGYIGNGIFHVAR